jgi:CRISPR-associated DxTHG motif protein
MRKIITFLGTRPQETVYEWQGKPYTGRVFAEALRQFVNFDKMLVLTTDEAAEKTWPVLAGLDDPRIEMVPIPDGKDTDGMWGIFQVVIDKVEEGENVIFDITHGYRSLPFLAFLFAAYLKTAKKVNIEAIYYGALEMAAQNNHKAPVIDLSQFVTMLDWITATDQFVQTGNAQQLAGLLNPAGLNKGVLFDASNTLQTISQAAFLCQPFTLMKTVEELEPHLHLAENELVEMARPYSVLRSRISNAFGQFQADFSKDVHSALVAEFRMVNWYYQNKQLIQAMSLAREWLIDAVTNQLGLPIDLRTNPRLQMERAVSGIAMLDREIKDSTTGEKYIFAPEDLNEYGRLIYDKFPEDDCKNLQSLWNSLQPIRNLFDHAEHQVGAIKTQRAVEKADRDVIPKLHSLAIKWGLAEEPN